MQLLSATPHLIADDTMNQVKKSEKQLMCAWMEEDNACLSWTTLFEKIQIWTVKM